MYRKEIRLSALNRVTEDVVDLLVLKQSGLLNANMKEAKIILSGEINRALVIRGLAVTAGARKAIEALGGKVEG